MSLTPNYSFIIPTGSDAVNLLTQCYPNFTSLDSILKPIQESGVTVATDTKVGTVHQLVRTDSSCNMFRFIATGNYASGDTFTVDGASVTATAMDGTALPAGAFVINQSVVCILNNLVLTVLIAGKETASLPASAVTYDNTGSGLTATNVQNAIDEVYNAIPTIPAEHGIYEVWVNPDTTIAYEATTFSITTDKIYDTFIYEMGDAPSGNSTCTIMAEVGKSSGPYLVGVGSGGDIIRNTRTVSSASIATGYQFTISSEATRTRSNTGTVTNTSDDSKMIPIRILGILHNN